jgi:hypothetical protein
VTFVTGELTTRRSFGNHFPALVPVQDTAAAAPTRLLQPSGEERHQRQVTCFVPSPPARTPPMFE